MVSTADDSAASGCGDRCTVPRTFQLDFRRNGSNLHSAFLTKRIGAGRYSSDCRRKAETFISKTGTPQEIAVIFAYQADARACNVKSERTHNETLRTNTHTRSCLLSWCLAQIAIISLNQTIDFRLRLRCLNWTRLRELKTKSASLYGA